MKCLPPAAAIVKSNLRLRVFRASVSNTSRRSYRTNDLQSVVEQFIIASHCWIIYLLSCAESDAYYSTLHNLHEVYMKSNGKLLLKCCKVHYDNQSVKVNWQTLRSKVKSCLSPGWLPRVPGNSQSTSSPSKPWRRRNLAAWRLNVRRDSVVCTTGTNGSDPAAQPPTANSSCNCGRRRFNARLRAYRPAFISKIHTVRMHSELIGQCSWFVRNMHDFNTLMHGKPDHSNVPIKFAQCYTCL